jgi:hypothetical protein
MEMILSTLFVVAQHVAQFSPTRVSCSLAKKER